MCGELAVGVALSLGAFTGLATFAGAIMNRSYVMVETASHNGLLLTIEPFLSLAWKTGG